MKSAPHPTMPWLIVYTSDNCPKGHTERKTLSRDAEPPTFGPCQKCKWVGAKAKPKKPGPTAGMASTDIRIQRESKRIEALQACPTCPRCKAMEKGLSRLAKVLASLTRPQC